MLKTKKGMKRHYAPIRREEMSPGGGILSALRSSCFGTGIAAAVGAAMLFLGTAIAYAQPDPDPFAAPIGYAVTVLTALMAGAITSRRNGRGVLLCGLLSAACLLLVISGLSLLPVFSDTPPVPMGISLALHAGLLLFTIGGAYLGRRRGRR